MRPLRRPPRPRGLSAAVAAAAVVVAAAVAPPAVAAAVSSAAGVPPRCGQPPPTLVASPPAPLRYGGARAQSAPPSRAGSPAWTRTGVCLALGLLVAAATALCSLQGARAVDGSVPLYFGQGCFWHVQHDLVGLETRLLRRPASQLTAVAGYAGSRGAATDDAVCYHNRKGAPDYGKMGFAEAVRVSVPKENVKDFMQYYFDAASKTPFGRNDPQDLGSEYRSVIGLPGGLRSPFVADVEAANDGRVRLLEGVGDDADTLMRKEVYVYDSAKFPFFQAELYHQFHDDMLAKYREDYHQLKARLEKVGKLKPVACPDEDFQGI